MTETSTAVAEPLLHLNRVEAGYHKTVALREVDVTVPQGSIVGLLGPNGAGKTTLLRVAMGLIRPSKGTVTFDGEDLGKRPPCQRSKTGICLIPEGRGIFREQSVRDNLRLFLPERSRNIDRDIAPAIEAFPVLRLRMKQIAGSLSGGEQQMLAVARAYLCNPKLVMADELSMGLAPLVVDSIYESLKRLNAQGVSLLIVEQYAHRILNLADEVYVLSRSEVVWSGKADAIDEEELVNDYLGEG
jgi:branched-chain amino acid transport system ATP-binding protein